MRDLESALDRAFAEEMRPHRIERKPCKYCSGEEHKVLLETKSEHEDTINYNIYISANAPRLVAMGDNWIDSFSTEIHYCPMCGRKLEGV